MSPSSRAMTAVVATLFVAAVSAQRPIVLMDSSGAMAARAFSDSTVLVTDKASGVVAPASIVSIEGGGVRTASGWATWSAGGSVLFTSPDCSTGAFVYTHASAGLRASAQVRTNDGVVLHVGAVGVPRTVDVRSILYDTGCSPVSVRQNGLVPVDLTIDLTTVYPPPLSFQ